MKVHSKRFLKAIEDNGNAKDVGYHGASLLAHCRRALDNKEFYSTSNLEKYLIEVDRSFGTCPFAIVADIANRKIILEAEIIDTDKAFIDEIVDIVNEINNDLRYGFCMLIDNIVIYHMSNSYYLMCDDMDAAEMIHRLIENFICDYLTIMQGAYCDMVSIIEKDFFSNFD